MIILKLIESLAIIAVSLSAVFGIYTWRKETRWKRKHELAEDVLAKFYESLYKIRIIRSPFGYKGEGQYIDQNKDNTETVGEIRDKEFAIYQRYDKNKEVFDKLQALKFRFIAIFGKENIVIFDELEKIINTILNAASELASIRLGEHGEMNEDLRKELVDYKRIIYYRKNEKGDEIEKQLNELIKNVESICNKIIVGKYS